MRLFRRLSDRLTLVSTPRFPARFPGDGLPHRVTVGIGGNVGDVVRRFEKLLLVLDADPRVALEATAPILKNPPFGFTGQADFFNSVLVLRTSMQPRAFMRYLLRIERRFGRVRSFPNAPRTLDLDILFFDRRCMDAPDLTLPHPHWRERESVLIPLTLLPASGNRTNRTAAL